MCECEAAARWYVSVGDVVLYWEPVLALTLMNTWSIGKERRHYFLQPLQEHGLVEEERGKGRVLSDKGEGGTDTAPTIRCFPSKINMLIWRKISLVELN